MALTVFPLPQIGMSITVILFVCQRYGLTFYPAYIFVDPKTQRLLHHSGGNKLSGKQEKAWKYVDKLMAHSAIDQGKFAKSLAFYTRINPKYSNENMNFEQLVQNIRYARYVACNFQERENARVHYNCTATLECLIQRSLRKLKSVSADLLEKSISGNKFMICVLRP